MLKQSPHVDDGSGGAVAGLDMNESVIPLLRRVVHMAYVIAITGTPPRQPPPIVHLAEDALAAAVTSLATLSGSDCMMTPYSSTAVISSYMYVARYRSLSPSLARFKFPHLQHVAQPVIAVVYYS